MTVSETFSTFAVCVPAYNEAERLSILIEAIAAQDIGGIIPICLCVNNTNDNSIGLLSGLSVRHAGRLSIHVDEVTFPKLLAHAGSARRRSMQRGASLLSAGGILISTDADTRPPRDWINENLRAIAAGVDIVGGRLVIDEAEPMAPSAARIRALWDLYWEKVRTIEDDYDPRPFDAPPRHGDHTGASLAITKEMFHRIGGVPLLPTGEDRALVAAAVAAGARLRHPMKVWTRVSPRRQGRASGGMAEAMAELHDAADQGREMLAPSFEQWHARATWRRTVRSRPDADALLSREDELLPAMQCDRPLTALVGAP